MSAAPDISRLNGQLLDVLALADQPRHDIADALGIEANAVRAHLSHLRLAGLWCPEHGETRVAMHVHHYATLFPLLEAQQIAELAADIRANGLNEPIVLIGDLSGPAVLDGRNRLAALRAAGLLDRAETVKVSDIARFFRLFGPEEGEPLAYVLSRNLHRRHLNESQRAMIAAKIAGFSHGGVRRGDQAANLRLEMTLGEAALALKISERAVQAARVVLDRGGAELAERVARGAVSVSAAETVTRNRADVRDMSDAEIKAAAKKLRAEEQAFKAKRRDEKEAALAARIADGNAALGAAGAAGKRFGVILADPEWRFEPFSAETGMDRAADNHYPTSPTEAIAARPVAGIAADDCVLFLWATAPMLPDALAVMAAWGFAYKTHLVWDKVRVGTGYWLRNRHELLLIGTRGAVPAPAMGTQPESIFAEAAGAHSAKPEGAYAMIEEWFPNLPKIELNARAARPGWDVWGAEAPMWHCGCGEVAP